MIVEAEFMRAVLCAVAGAKWLPDSGLAASEDVTAEVCRGLNLSVSLLRAGYLEVEAIQRMKIAVTVPESGLVELGVDPVLERPMLIKVARPRTDRLDETRRQAFASIKRGVYECAVGMVRIEHGEIDDDGLPSFEEFSALCDWMVVGDWGIAEPILWLLLGDIYFGATVKDDTVVVPDAQQLALLTHHSNQLARPAGTAAVESVIERIQALTLAELDLACIAIGDAFRVHEELVSKDGVVSDTIQAIARMTGYIQSAILGTTKEVAAEHTAYLYNRDAQAAGSEDEAEQLFAVAMGCADYARQVSRHNRHAKYLAQNLLEIAHLRVDASLRALAESIWIDAYATPFLLGHFATDTPFEELGWSDAIYSTEPTVRWNEIPPYSEDPDFIYAGRGAEVLAACHQSWPTDAWAAAVLVAQHSKDAVGELPIDGLAAVPLFVPGELAWDAARFPLALEHPTAWLYLLCDRLLQEHMGAHLHAGMSLSVLPNWDQSRWLDEVVDDAELLISGEARPAEGVPLTLPLLAATIILPAAKHLSELDAAGWPGWFELALAWGAGSPRDAQKRASAGREAVAVTTFEDGDDTGVVREADRDEPDELSALLGEIRRLRSTAWSSPEAAPVRAGKARRPPALRPSRPGRNELAESVDEIRRIRDGLG